MWLLEPVRTSIRLLAVIALAGLTAGCFQPLYGDRTIVGGEGVGPKLAGVSVAPIDTPNGTPLARVGVNLRNDLIFGLTGGSGGAAPTHRLDIHLASRQLQVIVDVNTARPDVQNYGIDATYTLTDLATGKKVISGQTFSRVSYDIPGQQQRFAGARGLRDAEDRAAQVIADNIRSRLASYFVAGS
ncbi:MAG TPA: LPS assembly lipoprotein LptE [Pseudolabrys sp.]|jgi:LPS-assembly lipoprotein|nr:LPS assembly lipoprotein LptE [Pseudolabrys sp.]